MTITETLRALDAELQGVSQDLIDLFNDNEEQWNLPPAATKRIEEI